MMPGTMPICEVGPPPPPVRFVSWEELDKHVVKHVLEGRDERWEEILDPEVLANALKEWWDQGCYGPNCEKIADEYERVVADEIVRACASGHWHQHLAEFRPQSKKVVNQTCIAWPPESVIRIIAKGNVRGERMLPYTIRSALRPWSRLTSNSFVSNSVRWAADRERKQERTLVVVTRHY